MGNSLSTSGHGIFRVTLDLWNLPDPGPWPADNADALVDEEPGVMRLSRLSFVLSRWPVGLKFAVAVGAVVLGVLAVAVVGASGLVQLRSDVDRLTSDDLANVRAIGDLAIGLYTVQEAVLAELAASGVAPGGRSEVVDGVLLPQLDERLAGARERFATHPEAAGRLAVVNKDLEDYLALRRSGQPVSSNPADRAVLVGHVAATFDRMTDAVRTVRDGEYAETRQSGEEARRTSTAGLWQLIIGALVSLFVALTVVLLLVRDLVPRLRLYARFATDVAAGRRVGTLDPRGSDELTVLGRALDDMVEKMDAVRRQEADQAEFVETLQVTVSEEEAHELVQRHLQRSLPGSTVVVLASNNSENRLEAATAVATGSALATRLPGAEPRTCLALRFGRTHGEDPARTPLLSCHLCADGGTRSTCEPLLVGGQVIGSVLVVHDHALDSDEELRIRNSVTQAAPVLGNLRNLALAEFRANNDSLTGLPNKRATDDTLKRMVAQANRSITPLTAAMLDLDHFKQINDRFGHAKGDEVLAAVGATLRSCIRASDFAGRFGGEELLVLFPDTDAGDVVPLAERIRSAVASIKVPEVERAITVSIGVAELIQHGGDAPGLLRHADRALYTAKSMGRNRVVVGHADGCGETGTAAWPGAVDEAAASDESIANGGNSAVDALERIVGTGIGNRGRT
jgi:diguanylate cyclase